MHIFVVGYPETEWGADAELWHVLRLWRRNGVEVTLIPTWTARPEWREKLDSIGAGTCLVEGPGQIRDIPQLAGSVVVSFCNDKFLQHADIFRRLGCRLVWAACATWLLHAEQTHYRDEGPFDAYVVQSRYQRQLLFPQLARYGVKAEQCHLIRGALDTEEFPFQPKGHAAEEPFVVGRLSRADVHQWSSQTWEVFESIPFLPLKARVMAWDDGLSRAIGPPPARIDLVPEGQETAHGFLSTLHCLVQLAGLAAESWPRVGLEAMATGVPIVADRRGGWLEMIDHGETGLLTDKPEQTALCADQLARREDMRMAMVTAAQKKLVTTLANPRSIMDAWSRLFRGLGI